MSRHFIATIRWSLARRTLLVGCALRRVQIVNEPTSCRLQRKVKRSRA